MANPISTVQVPLAFPIPAVNGAELAKLTLSRPKTKTVKKIALAFGPAIVKLVMTAKPENANVDAVDAVALAEMSSEEIADLIGEVLTETGLDAVTDVLADLTGQPAAVIDEIDPADYPALFGALTGFFPGLISAGA